MKRHYANAVSAHTKIYLADEVDADKTKDAERIAELEEMLRDVLEGQEHDYPKTYLRLEIQELLNNKKQRGYN